MTSLYDAERHVTHRCERMGEHHGRFMGNTIEPLPIPCPSCYSVESVWRQVPYEPESRSAVIAAHQPADDEPLPSARTTEGDR